MTGSMSKASSATERAPWRAVGAPTEHGGWGLTLEPVLLGLAAAHSWPGAAIGVAAVLAFLARTPTKLALIDLRRDRWRQRSRLAARIAAVELAVLASLVVLAIAGAGWRWIVPIAAALPLALVELWYDVRSRSRRLVPELCGAIGISSVAAAIIIAGDESWRLGVAGWLILTARATASIPFVRTQIARLRRGVAPTTMTLALQVAGVLLGVTAVAVDQRLGIAAVGVAALATAQVVWLRRPVPPARTLGLHQVAIGLALVVAAAVGFRTIG